MTPVRGVAAERSSPQIPIPDPCPCGLMPRDLCQLCEVIVPEGIVYVCEGWWHPNVKDGRVHDHPRRPNGGWSIASHRLCEQVYTCRTDSG